MDDDTRSFLSLRSKGRVRLVNPTRASILIYCSSSALDEDSPSFSLFELNADLIIHHEMRRPSYCERSIARLECLRWIDSWSLPDAVST